MIKLLVFVLLVAGCASKEVKKKSVSGVKLTILHTNDHHGHYLKDGRSQYGMAARATLLKRLRSEFRKKNIYHLLLSGGDINTGTMESDLFDAEPDFLGMKKLGYDAMAVGNHEFDNSYDVIKKQMEWAGFPFLSANIFFKGTNERVFNPLYLIKEYEGYKVGIFGLTTKDTPFKASSEDAKEKFDFRNIIDSARGVVQILKKEHKVDLVIAVTHVGHNGSISSNGDIKLAKAVDGIDVIVGGHSQEVINAEVHNNAIIVQAKDWGKYVGRLDLKLEGNKKKMLKYTLIPVNLKKKVDGNYVFIEKEIPEDKDMLELFDPYKVKAEGLGKKVLGTLNKTLDGDRFKVRRKQMPIAQFVGASMLNEIKDIEVAVINGGSIRASLNGGTISRKDLHTLHPYGNAIISVKLKPSELFDYISELIKINLIAEENIIGGYPHYVNMKVTIKGKELESIELKNSKLKITKANKNVLSQTITLGTLNFLARGGDNYPKLNTHKTYVDTGFMINTAMMNFVEKNKKLKKSLFEKKTQNILIIK